MNENGAIGRTSREKTAGILVVCLVAILFFSPVSLCQADVQTSYLYSLSDFSGPVPSLWARVSVDSREGEVFTLNRKDSAIQIFNRTAMQIYNFGESLNLASASDLASGEGGESYVLFRSPAGTVLHLDFKGEVLGVLTVDSLPGGFEDFAPDLVDYRGGRLYLADSAAMTAVVLQGETVENRYDIRARIVSRIEEERVGGDLRPAMEKKLEEEMRALEGASLTGFCADGAGNIYFTIATLFTAGRMNAAGELEQFGVPGGAPGKFGVVASIDADSSGHIFVADRLRCVVLIFDRDFDFLGEFGYRGSAPQNLLVPDDIAFDEISGRIYVSQAANLGVSVFAIKGMEPAQKDLQSETTARSPITKEVQRTREIDM